MIATYGGQRLSLDPIVSRVGGVATGRRAIYDALRFATSARYLPRLEIGPYFNYPTGSGEGKPLTPQDRYLQRLEHGVPHDLSSYFPSEKLSWALLIVETKDFNAWNAQ